MGGPSHPAQGTATRHALNPASQVSQGITTSVSVTGLSTAGEGFFNPDASFPNHITAAVNGGGITVNSVTVNSPTNLTLGLTIAAGAVPGARTITVTNPDGQSATSATGILNVVSGNSPPVINAASISPATPVTTGIVATVTSFTDADGNPVTYTYQWQQGDVDIPHTAATLAAAATVAGGNYRCIITPNDGQVDGAAFTTDPVSVPLDADGNGINDDWEYQHFGSVGIDPAGDADGDGMTNRDEFVFGLDPNSGSSVSPLVAQLDPVTGRFSYTRATGGFGGLTYTIWTSADLQTCTQDTGAVQTPGAEVDHVETVEVTLSADKPLAATRLFVRIRAD